MIRQNEVYKIGMFNKPHGVRGELSFTFTDDVFDRVDCDYLVCLIDGIFVPFFIEEYRFRSETTALVKLKGIDTADKARAFTNTEVYFPVEYAAIEQEDEGNLWRMFIGYTLYEMNGDALGEIVDVDDSTENVLLMVDHQEKELLVPAHTDLIVSHDKMHRMLYMKLPEGLREL